MGNVPVSPNISRAPATASSRAPFLGGPLSALLVGLCLPPYDQRVLAWFALVPLLLSLHRHRQRPVKRWLHGLACGGILAVWYLLPPSAATIAAGDGGWEPWRECLATLGPPFLIFTLSWGVFAGLAGPVFREPSPWFALAGLSALWAAIEYVRVEYDPVGASWIALGETVDPSHPEAQIASVLGLLGLSSLLVFANTAFLLVLTLPGWRRQAVFAAAGCAAGIACVAPGFLPPSTPGGPRDLVSVALIQSKPENTRNVLGLVESVLPEAPELVLFSVEASSPLLSPATPEGSRLRELVRHHDLDLVLGVQDVAEQRETALRALLVGFRPSPIPDDGAGAGDPPALVRVTSRVPGVVPSRAGRLAVLGTEDLDRSHTVRALVEQGTEIVVGVGTPSSVESSRSQILDARRHAFRALEAGRWLLEARPRGISQVRDPRGRTVDEAPAHVEWAVVEDVEPLGSRSLFYRWGWVGGPLALIGAVAFLLRAALSSRRRLLDTTRLAR